MEENLEDKTQQSKDSENESCPMSSMCKCMMGNPKAAFFLMIPGVLLIIFGILIIVKPKILVWLMASALIFIGIMIIVCSNFIRHMASLK